MNKKARTPLLIGHIIGIVGILAIIILIFLFFTIGGIFVGSISSIGGSEAGSDAMEKFISVGYLIDILLALIIILDVINLICGFRKKPSGKTLSSLMIANMSLTSLLSIGTAAYFIRAFAMDIGADSSNMTQSITLTCIASALLLIYLTLYILTITFIYVPRIKNTEANV